MDTAKWHVHNSHLTYWPTMPNRRNYKTSNVYIEDGAVVLRTIKESEGVYSTGSLDTARDDGATGPHRFVYSFGYYEARVKFPTQPGHWPAFWLYDDVVMKVDQSGRDGTEIDIMEKAYLDDKLSHALHWDGYDEGITQGEFQAVTGRHVDDGGWHTVGLDWTPTEYVFYVDGVESWRTSGGGVCQVPLFVWLSEEITDDAGSPAWGAAPTSTGTFPDYYRVDYVRIFKKL